MKKIVVSIIFSLVIFIFIDVECFADAAAPMEGPMTGYVNVEEGIDGIPYGGKVEIWGSDPNSETMYIIYRDEDGEDISTDTSAKNILLEDFSLDNAKSISAEKCFTIDTTYVYEGPSIFYDIIGEIPEGVDINLTATHGDYFSYTEYEGLSGWVLDSFTGISDKKATIMHYCDLQRIAFPYEKELLNFDQSSTGKFIGCGEEYRIIGYQENRANGKLEKIEYNGDEYYIIVSNYEYANNNPHYNLIVTNPEKLYVYTDYSLSEAVHPDIPKDTILEVKTFYSTDKHEDYGYCTFDYNGQEYIIYTLDAGFFGYFHEPEEFVDYGVIKYYSLSEPEKVKAGADILCYEDSSLQGESVLLENNTKVIPYEFVISKDYSLFYIPQYGWTEAKLVDGRLSQLYKKEIKEDDLKQATDTSEDTAPEEVTEEEPVADVTELNPHASFVSRSIIISGIFVLLAVGAGIAGIVLLKKKK